MKTIIILLVTSALVLGACAFGSGGGDSEDTGQPTAKWFVEKGPPSNSQGANGDLYLDTDAALLYVKVNGQWQAAASLRGPSGSGWLFGAGTPASSLGSDGDLYLDTSTSLAYRKMNGAWETLFALKGATGEPGTQWYSGSSVPTLTVPATARPGDYYLQTSTAIVYRKDGNGNWNTLLLLSYSTPSFIYTPHMNFWDHRDVYFNAVAYGNGIYVAVGNSGTIIRSTDGTNWQLVETNWGSGSGGENSMIPKGLEPDPNPGGNIPADLDDVAYGNGTFIAVGHYIEGENGSVYTSSNGISWDDTPPTTEELYYRIEFLNGKFYLSTASGTIYSTFDGSSWNSYSVSEAAYLSNVAYGNGIYLVFSTVENVDVYTSEDGSSWQYTNVAETGLTASSQVSSVTFGSGLFVAVGKDEGSLPMIWLSTDGITWSSQDLPVSSSVEFYDIAYGNVFALVGYDGYSGQNLILTSANGISWNIQALPYGSQLVSIYPCAPAGTFVIARGGDGGE